MSTPTPRPLGDNPSALRPGTRLGEFELLSVLGIGGFGIVYLAFDHALEREVAVKEYMPASLAGRTETMHVSLRSQGDADTFALGLKSFVNEAKLLARFDHPSLLKVHRFWEANGTAYMAMPVMRGRTLKEARAEMMSSPDEAWLRAMLGPLLGAIEKLHSEGVYHRDIAPDNIQIEPDGHPVLLDFGAARRVISDKSQMLTAILKPAYAPIEQYAEAGSVKQGPWTDLYALGATLHYLLMNRPPPPATTRAVHDDASALSTEACIGCSDNFLRIIDWMLAPRPADRPQSVAALREVLDGHALAPRRRVQTEAPASQWDRTVILDSGSLPPRAQPPDDDDATRVLPPVPRAAAPAATATSATSATSAPAAPAALTAAPEPGPPTPLLPSAATPLPATEFSAPPGSASLASERPPTSASKLTLIVGAGVVAVAVAAFAMWPRPVSTPAASAAASAPVAAAPEPAPPPPSSSVPESAITTVVVPGTPASRPPVASADPAPAANLPLASGRPSTSAAKPANRPPAAGTRNSAGPAAPVVSPQATAPTQAPAQTDPARTAIEAAAAPQPALVALEPPKPAVVAGPQAKCGDRNAVRYFFCMERECLRSEFSGHADCAKWRKEARRETN